MDAMWCAWSEPIPASLLLISITHTSPTQNLPGTAASRSEGWLVLSVIVSAACFSAGGKLTEGRSTNKAEQQLISCIKIPESVSQC